MQQWLAAVMLMAAWLCLPASAQNAADDQQEEILLSIDVGFNTAYRDKTWVPVEVLIVNEQDDLEGWLEVSTFDGANQRQSPIYRVAVDCPRASKKIYRVNAYLDTTYRVEAMLFEKGRQAVDVPTYVQTRPIERDDLLAMVLDDDAVNFGFLYNAVQLGGVTTRFFRHGLATSQLARLPNIAQAYDAFDVIILGDISPDRVPATARRLIRKYVEKGGSLVVCTGLHAAAYRGSWVEELLGVRLGAAENSNGLALARRTLPQDLQEGARAERGCVVVDLQPLDENVRTVGGEKVLATLHQVGRGKVYTLAVDAESHVLQDTPGYRALWREMVRSRENVQPLNFGALSRTASQALPSLSGVTIRPLSSVMIYLLLYLGVGIVGNWLFWNKFKRREMAWVCLIVFSMGFTAYAMAYGRSGWTQSAELQRLEVLHLRSGRGTADYHGLIGILTARTRSYSALLSRDDFLVRDAAAFNLNAMNMGRGFSQGMARPRPFYFIQDAPGRIDNFQVGASELRLMHVDGELPIQGQIEGTITADDDGIRGTLTNRTGLTLEEPMLLYNGHFLSLEITESGWSIAMDARALLKVQSESTHRPEELMYLAFGGQIDLNRVRRLARIALFSDEDMQIGLDHPAYVVGWAQDFQADALIPEQEVTMEFSQTLMVAEVDLVERDIALRTPLSLSLRMTRPRWIRPEGSASRIFSTSGTTRTPGELLVRVPDALFESPGEIVVNLYWTALDDDFEVYLAAKGESSRALGGETVAVGGQTTPSGVLRQTEYRISDWERHLDTLLTRTLSFSVVCAQVAGESADGGEERQGRGRGSSAFVETSGNYVASAAFIVDEEAAAEAQNNSGDWPLWQ